MNRTCLNLFSSKYIYTRFQCARGPCCFKKEMDFGLFVMLIVGILHAHAAAQLLAPYAGPTGGLASLGLSPQELELAEDTAANFLGMASGIVAKRFWEKQWKKPQTANLPTLQ